MATSYEKIYENLLPKFRSYEIPLMSTEEVKDYLHDFLIPAIYLLGFCPTHAAERTVAAAGSGSHRRKLARHTGRF